MPSTPYPPPTGLLNKGNTCYANTVLQALLHTPQFTGTLLSNKFDTYLTPRARVVDASQLAPDAVDPPNTPRAPATTGTPSLYFIKALHAVVHAVWTRAQRVHDPQTFLTVSARASLTRAKRGETTAAFVIGQQHDLPEFWTYVLDVLHDTTHFPVTLTVSGTPVNRGEKLLQQSMHTWGQHVREQYSFVWDVFGLQLYSEVIACDAPREHSETFEQHTMLMLDLPCGVRQCTLHDCLDLMTQPEILHDWKGTLNDTPRTVERRTHLWKLPQILVVQLKRFHNPYVKNNCAVQLHARLDVKDYVRRDEPTGTAYELYFIAHHEGALQGGHYYGDGKNSQHTWHRYNDSAVSPVEMTDGGHSSSAYVLFYQRVPDVVVG